MVVVQHSGKRVELLTSSIMKPQPDNVKSHYNTTKGLYVYLLIPDEKDLCHFVLCQLEFN